MPEMLTTCKMAIAIHLYDRKFETFQTLGNERPDVTVHYPDDGLGMVPGCRSLREFVNNIGAPLARETIRHSAKTAEPAGV